MNIQDIMYTVHLVPFPNGKTNELVTINEDSSYSIFINVNLNVERQKEAFIHALKHILGEDFGKTDVDAIEFKSHIA